MKTTIVVVDIIVILCLLFTGILAITHRVPDTTGLVGLYFMVAALYIKQLGK